MRQPITQVIIRKYLIGAIYTIISCGQSVKGVVSVDIIDTCGPMHVGLADDVAIIIVSIDEISDFGECAWIGIGIKPACAAEVIIAVRVSYLMSVQ